LTAAEINAVMRKYLFDDYRFTKTFDIYAFWFPFQSVHRSNKNCVRVAFLFH
jgi:hypothetical protein